MITTKQITFQTRGNGDIIDITADVERAVEKTGRKEGAVIVFIAGATAGVTTIEYEPGLVSDLKAAWERMVPRDIPYQHDARWGDGNGHSHVRATLLGASLVVPFSGGKLLLGTWQQIVVMDFDNRARSRRVVLQVSGE